MNKSLLNQDVQLFINLNLHIDLNTLRLGKSPFPDISVSELAEQIESKKHSRIKLPTWYAANGVYFPPKISVEQSSSEEAAKFKASLVGGDHLIDLTGGLGIDTYFFSKNFRHVSHCEINKELSEIAAHNNKILGADNISYLNTNGTTIILSGERTFDYVYIDPSRRVENRKVFMLEDCEPDILAILPALSKISKNVMIKTSPMLDISAGISAIGRVSSLYVVSLRNDCKELLWLIDQDKPERECQVICALLRQGHQTLTYRFLLSQEKSYVISSFSAPEKYLYEPDAALLKAGCFKLISRDFDIGKISTNTHLYTSSEERNNFPGRTFIIRQSWTYKEFTKLKDVITANISCRNFSLNPDTIRKKHKIQDGGDIYLFFCKNQNDKPIVIECIKV